MTTFTKDFRISLGLATTRGKLLTLKAATTNKATKMTTLCPVCKQSVCKQYLVPECGHLPDGQPGYLRDEVVKGQQNEQGKWVEFTADDIAVATGSDLPPFVMDLNVHPIEQVWRQTWPAGTMYWFQPDVESDAFYHLLCKQVGFGQHAFIALVNLGPRSGEKLCQLMWHNGGIVVQELLRPQDMESFEKPELPIEGEFEEMLDELVNHMVADFEPTEYHNDQGDKVRELLLNKKPARAKAKKAEPHPLVATLEAALQDARKPNKRKRKVS